MPEMNFEGTATWKGETESELTVKGTKIAVVSPPPSFGGKKGYCVPEEIFDCSRFVHEHAVHIDCEKL